MNARRAAAHGPAPLETADAGSDDGLLGSFQALFGQTLGRVTPASPDASRVVVDSSAPLHASAANVEDGLVGAFAALFDKIGGRPWFSFNYSAGPAAYPVPQPYARLDPTNVSTMVYPGVAKPTFPLCDACLQGWYLLGLLALIVIIL